MVKLKTKKKVTLRYQFSVLAAKREAGYPGISHRLVHQSGMWSPAQPFRGCGLFRAKTRRKNVPDSQGNSAIGVFPKGSPG